MPWRSESLPSPLDAAFCNRRTGSILSYTLRMRDRLKRRRCRAWHRRCGPGHELFAITAAGQGNRTQRRQVGGHGYGGAFLGLIVFASYGGTPGQACRRPIFALFEAVLKQQLPGRVLTGSLNRESISAFIGVIADDGHDRRAIADIVGVELDR